MNPTQEKNQLINTLYHFKRILHFSYSDACEAYSTLEKHDETTIYIIAQGYLSMSQQNHIELLRIYRENELDRGEIESYFKAYESYIFELKQVITDKDTNTSWLSSTHDSLIEAWKSTDAFIQQWINNTI
ncbi:hypothetical protein QP794_01670 [Paenibacillus sp. UMB7766-LJ446]|uniref:hypothetical protein n=1 Tax=Paenibacillus sp. UMB7766-LJ446 TaxID=3046313 RepID=UPI00254CCFA6|nr:hypothetical protein [Paenibacillus sp. UMB7766-LJ446]MDK8188790.1 hypothetical protein [Paenibacillus sp. UMB7766-LJ446]